MAQYAETAKKNLGKKKKKEKKKRWRCSSSKTRLRRPRLARDLGRSATQAGARPRSQRNPGLVRPLFLFLGFFFSLLWWTHIFCCCGFLLLLSLLFRLYFILIVNRVLETRFPCRCHVEKVPHQTWTTHQNRVSKTRFIDPKSSLLDSNC